jgi:hypothetical protein
MRKSMRWVAIIGALAALLLTGGCFGLGGSRNASETGSLTMFLVDAPASNIEEVNVRIKRVEVNRDGKWETLNNFAAQGGFVDVNLLDLRFDKALLGEQSLPAGAYSQIRLIVDETVSNVVIAGASYPLKTPSGAQTGLKINHDFVVPAGGAVALVLDADVSEFVQKLGSKDEYLMSPTAVRVVDLQSGAISGRVLAKANNLPIVNTDVVVTVWLDSNNDGLIDDDDPVADGVNYVARTLALREAYETHAAGEFQVNAIPALTLGKYIVEVSAAGFASATFTGVVVNPGSDTLLDANPLTPGVADPILLAAATAP